MFSVTIISRYRILRAQTKQMISDVPVVYQLSYCNYIVVLHVHVYWRSPYFVNMSVQGAPVRSHSIIYCPLAMDHAQVTIRPGNRKRFIT